MNFKQVLWLCIIMFFSGQTFAQFEKAKNPEATKEKYTIFVDLVKAKKYQDALAPLEWLLTEEPGLHKSIYINGEKVYKALARKEKDPAKKIILQDKVMNNFANRVTHFGQRASVVKRAGGYAYKYWNKRGDDYLDPLDSVYSEVYKLNGLKTPPSYLTILMSVVATKTKKGAYTEDQFLARYEEIAATAAEGVKTAKDEKDKGDWENTAEAVDQIMTGTIEMDCAMVNEKLGPKFRANPKDIKTAKMIINFMLKDKCTQAPLFIEAVKALVEQQPDYALFTLVAKHHLEKDEVDVALEWFEKAVKSAKGDAAKQGETYLDIAKVMSKKGRVSDSRTYAYKAAEADASVRSEAYSHIGHLYMQSANSCKGTNPVEQRYCFLAAYDMYAKAGNGTGMSNAKTQFPSRTDIFTYMNEKMDKSVNVGCWIGGTTTLRAR